MQVQFWAGLELREENIRLYNKLKVAWSPKTQSARVSSSMQVYFSAGLEPHEENTRAEGKAFASLEGVSKKLNNFRQNLNN